MILKHPRTCHGQKASEVPRLSGLLLGLGTFPLDVAQAQKGVTPSVLEF